MPQQGGGQRVAYLIAEALSMANGDFDVTVLSPKPLPQAWFEATFGVDFSNIRLRMVGVENQNGAGVTVLLEKFDIFINAEYAYWAIDPRGADKKYIIAHDAHPLGNEPTFLDEYDLALPSSEYGASKMEDEMWTIPSRVLYPPIFQPAHINWKAKQKRILCVARFDSMRRNNSLPVVVEGFRQAYDKGLTDYELVIAGALQNMDLFKTILERSHDYPIKLVPSPTTEQLHALYDSAKFLLNVRGIDSPMPTTAFSHEALGVVTVEAIAHGAIPIVHGFAGHKETVPDERLWIDEMENIPDRLIEIIKIHSNDVTFQSTWRGLHEHVSHRFSAETFVADFKKMLTETE